MQKLHSIVALLACVSLLPGRQLERSSCGTYSNNWREELALHRRAQAAQARAKLSSRQAIRVLPDVGNIAHLEDTDGVVVKRNPYNLSEKTIRFVLSPGNATYRFETTGSSYDAAAASAGTVVAGLGDDDTRELSLPFPFPFYGSEYRTFHLNSDGNITFGKGDAAITDRSLGRFIAGQPRIAAQFNDLDPSRATTGVKVRNEANRVVISWDQIPEYQDNGRGPLQTFQIRLFRDGTIEFAYGSGVPFEAVTGITPGGMQGEAALVAFAGGSPAAYTSTIAERFSGSESVDVFAAAQKFYRSHEDAYDYLVIYNTLRIPAGSGVLASEITVRNNREGFGDPPIEVGQQAGSKKRLQALVNMGDIREYPVDPTAGVPARLTEGDTPLSVIAHEMGHLFLAYVSVDDGTGGSPMLGHQLAHWNFTFNSEASLLEGNRIQDNGPSASPRFLTVGAAQQYSLLDQYLMGLRPSTEVPDTFYVRNTSGANTTGPPRTGVAFNGTRVDVTSRQIVEAAGRRTPDHTVAQRRFRAAFIIVTPEGQTPTAEQVAQVEGYRSNVEAFFAKATGQNATIDTTLRKAISVSAFPAVGVLANGKAPVNVSLEQPAAAALTLQVRSQSGRVRIPTTITIPAGAKEATFEVTGVSEGTDDLVIEPANSQFDSVTAKVQVSQPGRLALKVLSDASPVRVQVTDINQLPYPGIAVEARASAGGSLNRPSAVTGVDGVAEFQWAQSAQATNTLVAIVAGGPSTTINAAAAPAFAEGSVVNAASYAPGVVPQGLVTLFGTNLGGQNAQVTVNGRPVQVLFANATQVNFVAPLDLPEATAELTVRAGNATSTPLRVPVRAVQPGIFYDTATNVGAITLAGSGRLTPDQPPAAGEFISIYATGLGGVQFGPSGLDETVIQPEVFVGGVPAQVTFSGLAPGFVGLYQLNARVPAQTPAGPASVVISMQGVRSNEVRIQVR